MPAQTVRRIAAPVIALLALPFAATAQGAGSTGRPEMMSEREEVRLALSAGPPWIHDGAAVLVLAPTGFRVAREGTNGFHCFVERGTDPRVRAPQCLDAIASEYVLPVKLEEARLRLAGKTTEAIDAEIAEAFGEGRFRPPPEPAFSYMLSSGQYLGENVGRWNPHVMVYTPYRTNRELGGDPRFPQYPFIAFEEGRPLALTVIVTTEFVDPETVEIRP